jgi:hypothetical protein
LDNQKNGWRNVCVNHHHNGDDIFCPVHALGRRYIHIRKQMRNNWDTLLSTVWDEKGKKMHVTDKIIRQGLKMAATVLEYPERRGIPMSASILTLCELVEPMRCIWPVTATDIRGTKMTGTQYSLLYKAPFYSKYDYFSVGKIIFQYTPTGNSVEGFCK